MTIGLEEHFETDLAFSTILWPLSHKPDNNNDITQDNYDDIKFFPHCPSEVAFDVLTTLIMSHMTGCCLW